MGIEYQWGNPVQQYRVSEGLFSDESSSSLSNYDGKNLPVTISPSNLRANYVPLAAVIRRDKRYPGIEELFLDERKEA